MLVIIISQVATPANITNFKKGEIIKTTPFEMVLIIREKMTPGEEKVTVVITGLLLLICMFIWFLDIAFINKLIISFIVFFGGCILTGVGVFVMSFHKEKREARETEVLRKEIAEYYNAPLHYTSIIQNCAEGSGILREASYGIWTENRKLHFLIAPKPYAPYYRGEKNYLAVAYEDVLYYCLTGSEHYYTEISGGGGGGSSMVGALIGGALAGSTGAIIGSRRESAPIKTTVRHIDSHQTVICIKDSERQYSLFFYEDYLYKKLLMWFPEKEISVAQSTASAPSDYEERLNKLKELYEKKLISEEEYESKKNEILKSI